jgi:hypothetical protein
VSTEIEPRRVAGQHVRAEANRRGWLRFLGGRFKRDYGAWSQGAEGEEVVGEVLEGLIADGWQVIHDVSFGRGNIDHVVVGPGGLFTVEVIDRVPAKRGGVTILPARMLAWYFARRRPAMSVEKADEIYDRLCLAVGQPPSP